MPVSRVCIIALALASIAACSAVAQPIIDEVDITKASKELRRLLYERHELREEIGELQSEVQRLEQRDKSLTELVALQKQLDELWRQIDQAKEAGDEPLFEKLEAKAERLELAIEHRDSMNDVDGEISDAETMVTVFREFGAEELAAPLNEVLKQFRRFQAIKIELYNVYQSGPESEETILEQALEELDDELEVGREFLELAMELREAYEDDDEERVEEIMAELAELEGEMEDDGDEKLSEQQVDEEAEAVGKSAANDPTRQPIPVTEEALARVSGVTFEAVALPLLRKHCFECHSNDTQSGELNLEQMVTQTPLVVNRDKWINALEQAKNRVMPPEDEAQPDEHDRTQLVLVLHNAIHNFDYSNINDPGFERARRLTHDEYDNTVRDLFGVNIQPTKRFPSDMTGSSGFDNSANTLFLQPMLMERYMGAAEVVVDGSLPAEPVTQEHRAARQLVFGDVGALSDERADDVLARFLTRAYRRSPSNDELNRAKKFYAASRATGKDPLEAAKDVFRTSLISPSFLMKSERLQDPKRAFRIDDWELASRLSYFLWATMPDDELFELARNGTLHESHVLHSQVERMIGDQRSDTLGTIFVAQWLGSQHLGTRMRMDPIDNPWCTDSLMAAMRAETSMFFHTLVQENHPLPRLIDADFTFMNEELAKQYKIRGVRGEQMQRVRLENSDRGGIFGHGSLLAVTSFPYRTSPVVRGKWILADVLGTPPPPPPPNVSELPEEIEENDRLSFREKLELHRKAPNCYACHSQMDPLGFSLEGYDYFGRERKGRRRRKIDVAGELPNGTRFTGLPGLKKVVLEQRLDDLCRQVTSKMLSYALGRQLEYYDEPAVRKIVAALEADDYRLQTLIHAIVDSYPFQYKQVPEQ